jgi:hypothetical protein
VAVLELHQEEMMGTSLIVNGILSALKNTGYVRSDPLDPNIIYGGKIFKI